MKSIPNRKIKLFGTSRRQFLLGAALSPLALGRALSESVDSIEGLYAVPYARTLSQIKSADFVSAMRFIPQKAHSAILSGVGGYDTASALSSFFAVVKNGEIPAGCFEVDSAVILKRPGLNIIGHGRKTIIAGNKRGKQGDPIFHLQSGQHSFRGLTIRSQSTKNRGTAFLAEANGANITDLLFDDIFVSNCFYAIRATSRRKHPCQVGTV